MEKGERYLRKSESLRKHIRDQRLGQSSGGHKVKDSKTPTETPRSKSRIGGFDEIDRDSDEDEEDDDDDDEKDSDVDDETSKLERTPPPSYGNRSASDKDSLESSSSPEEEDEYLSSEKDSHEEVDKQLKFMSI